jgi:hypothetical protein
MTDERMSEIENDLFHAMFDSSDPHGVRKVLLAALSERDSEIAAWMQIGAGEGCRRCDVMRTNLLAFLGVKEDADA